MDDTNKPSLTELTVELVAAYVSRNSVPVGELSTLLQNVHGSLSRIEGRPTPEAAPVEELKPAVPIRKSITDDYIISLENGQKFKSLKRHLQTAYGMSPQQYREKWGLAKDYPMVAPGYAKSRSDLAKSLGLGRKASPAKIEEAMAEPVVEAPAPASPAPKTRKPRVAKAA